MFNFRFNYLYFDCFMVQYVSWRNVLTLLLYC